MLLKKKKKLLWNDAFYPSLLAFPLKDMKKHNGVLFSHMIIIFSEKSWVRNRTVINIKVAFFTVYSFHKKKEVSLQKFAWKKNQKGQRINFKHFYIVY